MPTHLKSNGGQCSASHEEAPQACTLFSIYRYHCIGVEKEPSLHSLISSTLTVGTTNEAESGAVIVAAQETRLLSTPTSTQPLQPVSRV